MNFNRVILGGNLTRDPQVKYTQNNIAICDFGVAINRKFKDRDEVTFIDVTAFDKIAETIAKHLAKGQTILIEGRLKFDVWDDKNGGGRRTRLTVICERFEFAGAPTNSDKKAEIPL